MLKRFFGIFLAVALMAAMLVPTLAFAETTMYVYTKTGCGLRVRSTPEVRKDNVLGSIKYGQPVQIDHNLTNGWTVIRYDNKIAYVSTRYLVTTKPADKKTPAPTPTPAPSDADTANAKALNDMNAEFKSAKKVNPYTVYVNPARVTSWLNLRWAPSTKAGVISTYKAGSAFTVIAQTNHWLQVQDPATGYVGYIWTDMTTLTVL